MESIKILLVEDDAGHARLIEKNLRRAGATHEMIVIDNGQDALAYLEANACEQGTHERLLVLLDLNLPVLSGYEVLEKIKTDKWLKKIPVFVLTTTDVPQEITKCYELGCNVFITKPVQYDEFCAAVRSLGLFLPLIKHPG